MILILSSFPVESFFSPTVSVGVLKAPMARDGHTVTRGENPCCPYDFFVLLGKELMDKIECFT